MVAIIVGLAIIAVPSVIAWRTLWKLTRQLGALEATVVAEALARDGQRPLRPVWEAIGRVAPQSIPARLLRVMLDDSASTKARELALAEEVAEIERDLVADARVPRVAASIATSGGLLAATWVMREGLGRTLPEGANVLAFFGDVIERGLTLAAIAVLGGIVCAALHRNAQRERRARLVELDALIAPLHARLALQTPPPESSS